MIVLDILYEKTKTIDSKVVDLVFSYACHNSSQNNIDVLNHIWVNWSDQIESIFGSIALLSHNTLKWSAILGLSFFAWYWLLVAQGIHAAGFKRA